MEKVCPNCNRTFKIYPSSVRKYCSRQCKTSDKTTTVVCRTCGRESRVPKSLERPYCSRKCMLEDGTWKKAISRSKTTVRVCKTCETCGTAFFVTKGLANRRHHCSRSCRSKDPAIVAKTVKGTLDYYAKHPDHWRKVLESANRFPNGLEQYFHGLFPQLEYVGNGKTWLSLRGGKQKCPDFALQNTSKIIEVWGDYWHRGGIPEDMVAAYAEIGYDCLVLWESEIRGNLEETITRVNNFLGSA